MSKLVQLTTFSSEKGDLTVFEKILPGELKRAFYIYNVDSVTQQRALHGHRKESNALIALNGNCRIFVTNGVEESYFHLTRPDECLVIEPGDWHIIDEFSKETILLVLSNEHYDPSDYFFDRP
ncbi:sugar 3,4-ketoisomerase [Larkinella terrae]|uniref:WxcM-like domain-containing protein n=1 Tax=Larkinella terrae TaxID=2025311 RepID=A0A7K0EG59_9BACT|nr:FdtA/QdtA family cupin domain-containing protein [Larkinella terrae]MRS60692.1 WxcM-like domain-containing protein [Larkinella terrae]